ncbi:MAG: hypothetical protein M0010_06100 [Actinomycetota bacterium]|nr:hypothetical protein [Actinomycetota bacterium]
MAKTRTPEKTPTLWCPDCEGSGEGDGFGDEWSDGEEYPCARCDGSGELPRAVVLGELRAELRRRFATANADDAWEGYAERVRQAIEVEVGNDPKGYAAMEWDALGIVPVGFTPREIVGAPPAVRFVPDPDWPSPRKVRRMVHLTLPEALRGWDEQVTFHVVDEHGEGWDVMAFRYGTWTTPRPCSEPVHLRGRFTKDELAAEAKALLVLTGRMVDVEGANPTASESDADIPEWDDDAAAEMALRQELRGLYWRTVGAVQRYFPRAERGWPHTVTLRCSSCGCRALWPAAWGLVPKGDGLVEGITWREPAEVLARVRPLPVGGFAVVEDSDSGRHLEPVVCGDERCPCHTASEPAPIEIVRTTRRQVPEVPAAVDATTDDGRRP